jgi:ABC-type transport system involved in cytochrome bd biosynthesis fused ATPase/permease subunit
VLALLHGRRSIRLIAGSPSPSPSPSIAARPRPTTLARRVRCDDPLPSHPAGDLMRVLLAAALACVVLAVAVGVLAGSQAGTAIAIALGGTAFVLVISAAFYAVGRSEDREREQHHR